MVDEASQKADEWLVLVKGEVRARVGNGVKYGVKIVFPCPMLPGM